MKYVYNNIEYDLTFKKEDFDDIVLSDDLLENINLYLAELLRKGEDIEEDIYNEFVELFENEEAAYNFILQLIKTKTGSIRSDILPKFLSADNLNFLCSNGCSLYAGSKHINENEEAKYKELLASFNFGEEKKLPIVEKIQQLVDERPEVALNKLIEIQSFYENIYNNKGKSEKLAELIDNVKKSFLQEFVYNIDYENNHLHKKFIKKILSRDTTLGRIKLFTLNYDLLFEKTAEELGYLVNNGFIGFQNRIFNPSSFNLDYHLLQSSGAKKINKSFNLVKLHGSISWFEDENKPPYGLIERQVLVNNEILIKDEAAQIIYPIHNKKKKTLDLPYSELFRYFVDEINKPKSTLCIMGYSFLDEHVNDVILGALSNPDFNLVIFSYDDIDNTENDFLKTVYSQSFEDNRITIFTGDVLGDFEYILKFLLPVADEKEPADIVFSTFQKLLKANK